MLILRAPDAAAGTLPPAGTPGTPNLPATPPGGTPPLNDFIKGLPADLQTEKSLHNYTNVNDLAKGFVHAQKLIGAKRVEAPQPTWGDGEWNQFFEVAGRPKTADEYKVPEYKFESQPDLKPDATRLKAILPELHKAGLTQKQVDAVLTTYFKTTDQDLKTVKQSQSERKAAAEAELKAEWGDKFDTQVDLAKSVVQKFGDEKFMHYIAEEGGNDPRLIKMLSNLGAAMMEDKSRGGNAANGLQVTDATRAVAEINRLKLDKEFMTSMTRRDHPAHKAAVQQWMNLHKIASPGTQVEPA